MVKQAMNLGQYRRFCQRVHQHDQRILGEQIAVDKVKIEWYPYHMARHILRRAEEVYSQYRTHH